MITVEEKEELKAEILDEVEKSLKGKVIEKMLPQHLKSQENIGLLRELLMGNAKMD